MRVASERVLREPEVDAFYPSYVSAFEPLLTEAAARHVLTAGEFAREMVDPRIEKFVVREDDGGLVALTTLTDDVSAVEWINPDYYRFRFPDAARRGALFYLGYTLVQRSHRRSSALLLMAAEVNARVAAVRGVIGFDICAHNDAHGIGRFTSWIFRGSEVGRLDTQTYYTADYRGVEPDGRRRDAGGGTSAAGRPEELRITTLADRPDLVDDIAAVLTSRWPAFMLAARPGHDVDLEALLGAAPAHQILVIDGDDRLQGVGTSVPVHWDGTLAGLPSGWDDAVSRAHRLVETGGRANTACALSVTLTPQVSGRGVAGRVIGALRDAVARAGGTTLIAPVRPVRKPRYPLVAMADYLSWRTPDGEDFDPWLRLHRRLGGRLLTVAAHSMRLSGTVEDWRSWTGEELPGPGSFVVPGALAPLQVDGGIGTYVEPNVWMAHPVRPACAQQAPT